MTKRALWADMLRILAIYLVLVAHSSILPQKIYLPFIDIQVISYAIAKTCVPLFAMLSGALLLSKKESYKVFFKKRLARLLFPWLTWTIIYTLITIFQKQSVSFIEIPRLFITQLESFWFLPMIFCLYLFTPAIRVFMQSAKKVDIWFVIFLWFMLISFLPYTRDSLAFPKQVDDGLVRQIINFSGYFLLGYALWQTSFFKKWWISAFCICIGMVWTISYIYITSMQKGGILAEDFYSYVSPGIVLLSAGIFLYILFLGNKLEKKTNKYVKKSLMVVSTFALAIYFMHALIQQLFMELLKRQNLFLSFPLSNFVNGIILFCISFFILYVFYKIPFVKRFIL